MKTEEYKSFKVNQKQYKTRQLTFNTTNVCGIDDNSPDYSWIAYNRTGPNTSVEYCISTSKNQKWPNRTFNLTMTEYEIEAPIDGNTTSINEQVLVSDYAGTINDILKMASSYHWTDTILNNPTIAIQLFGKYYAKKCGNLKELIDFVFEKCEEILDNNIIHDSVVDEFLKYKDTLLEKKLSKYYNLSYNRKQTWKSLSKVFPISIRVVDYTKFIDEIKALYQGLEYLD